MICIWPAARADEPEADASSGVPDSAHQGTKTIHGAVSRPHSVMLPHTQAEWYTPLLVPWVHYIPVAFYHAAHLQRDGGQVHQAAVHAAKGMSLVLP